MRQAFDPGCRQCPRLAEFLDRVGEDHPDYHARPVAPFGDARARLLVVGLAPGMHGANATGRPFTGDHAGILLYETLYRHGFASSPTAVSIDDGLVLPDCRITNAVKCLPPQNKPTGGEINTCRQFLEVELAGMPENGVIVALGAIAHRSVVAGFGLKQKELPFAHAAEYRLPQQRVLLDSYHCSRYNTQTRRLTASMFDAVFARARELIDG